METLYIEGGLPFQETLKGKERREKRFSLEEKGEKGDKRKENWGRRCSMASKNKLIVWSEKENIIFLCVCLAIDVEAERQYNLFRINMNFRSTSTGWGNCRRARRRTTRRWEMGFMGKVSCWLNAIVWRHASTKRLNWKHLLVILKPIWSFPLFEQLSKAFKGTAIKANGGCSKVTKLCLKYPWTMKHWFKKWF